MPEIPGITAENTDLRVRLRCTPHAVGCDVRSTGHERDDVEGKEKSQRGHGSGIGAEKGKRGSMIGRVGRPLRKEEIGGLMAGERSAERQGEMFGSSLRAVGSD